MKNVDQDMSCEEDPDHKPIQWEDRRRWEMLKQTHMHDAMYYRPLIAMSILHKIPHGDVYSAKEFGKQRLVALLACLDFSEAKEANLH